MYTRLYHRRKDQVTLHIGGTIKYSLFRGVEAQILLFGFVIRYDLRNVLRLIISKRQDMQRGLQLSCMRGTSVECRAWRGENWEFSVPVRMGFLGL
jgi:hypothetical protein